MSVNLDQIVNTDTFGVWKDRTNEIVNALQDVVSLGDSDLTNANGNVVINGYVKAYEDIQTDTITPVSGAGSMVFVNGSIRTNGYLYVDNSAAGTPTRVVLRDDNVATWRMATNSTHTTLNFETLDLAHALRLNSDNNLIEADGMTIDPSIVTNLNASSVTSGTFSTARIPNLSATKITTGTFGVDRIPTLPTSKISAGTFTGDYTIDNGSLFIDNNDDGSVLLTLQDTSAVGDNKVMMRFDGVGNNLEVINYNDSGDYELRSDRGSIRYNDEQIGIQIMHANINDPNGFTTLGDTYPDNAPLEVSSRNSDTVEVVTNAPLRVNSDARFEGDINIVNGNVTGNGTVPVGAVMPFMTEYRTDGRGGAPKGWLFLDGTSIPNGTGTVQGQWADYSELHALLVDLDMPIDGGNRRLPDMRGQFARGFDPRTGSLTNAIGVYQEDQLQDHTHDVSPAQLRDDTGDTVDGPNKDNDADVYTETSGVTSGSARVGSETRPKNVAFLYCIKAY